MGLTTKIKIGVDIDPEQQLVSPAQQTKTLDGN